MIFQAYDHIIIRYQPDSSTPNYTYNLIMADIDKERIDDLYIRETRQLKPSSVNVSNLHAVNLSKSDEISVYKIYLDKFIFIFEDSDIAIKYFKYITSIISGENREITEVYPELFL